MMIEVLYFFAFFLSATCISMLKLYYHGNKANFPQINLNKCVNYSFR